MSTKSLQANPFFFLWIQLAGFLFPYPSAIVVAQLDCKHNLLTP